MLMRPMFAVCVLVASCCPVSAQGNSAQVNSAQSNSPRDTFDQLKGQKDGTDKATTDGFNILDLPSDLFNRRPDTRPRIKLPPLQLDRDWDYRFDAQYQSTIRPYMRWYMRHNPKTPRERYLTEDYKSGREGFYASAEGYSAYSVPRDSYGQPMYSHNQSQWGSVRYWDHLNWLYEQYKDTKIDRSFKTSGRPLRNLPAPSVGDEETDPDTDADEADEADKKNLQQGLPDIFSQTRPAVMKQLRRQSIWVCRHRTTGQVSVLYVKPQGKAQAMFHEAQAAMTGGNSILALKWKSQPPWADKVMLDAGRLKSVKPDHNQVVSAK